MLLRYWKRWAYSRPGPTGWLRIRGRSRRLSWHTHADGPVNGFDEIVRGPGAGVGSVAVHVSPGRRGCLYLLQREPLFHQVADAVPDDGHHVAVIHHVELIAEPAVARNDQRAFFARNDRHRRNSRIH